MRAFAGGWAARGQVARRVALALVLAQAVGCTEAAGRDRLDAGAVDDAADAGANGAALYPRVQAILARSCAYQRCHAGPLIGGALSLARGSDYAAALVSVPACEYERMARVEPFDPERSWLMVKLTADFRAPDDPLPFYIHFEPDSDWDPEGRGCRDRAADGTPLFGQRMPLTAPNMLPQQDLDVLSAWIAAGAMR